MPATVRGDVFLIRWLAIADWRFLVTSTPAPSVTPIKHIVTRHDVTTVGEDVDPHGGKRQPS